MNFKSLITAIILQIALPKFLVFGLTADFTLSMESACAPSLVVFYNHSTQGPGIEYLWDFGKGAVVQSDEMILYESYTESGEYTITLRVIEGTDTVITSQEITIFGSPEANFLVEPSEGCTPLTVNITENSTAAGVPVTSFLWDFRDGSTATGDHVNHTYSVPGMYNVYLEITDDNGCSDFIEFHDVISVYDLPEARFAASDSFACDPPLNVTFTNLSSGFGLLDFFWDFGNGDQSTDFTGQTQYLNGTYDVSLSVTDQHGCIDTVSHESLITVGRSTGYIYAQQGDQRITANGSLICPGIITLHSTLPDLEDITWEIDYAGSTQIFEGMKEVELPVPDSGRLDIMLRYNEAQGCGDTLFRNFRIDHIRADFAMSTSYTCQLPIDVDLENLSENASTYLWIMPGEPLSTEINSSFTFPRDTSYLQRYTHDLLSDYVSVILIATNANGCSDTLIRNLEINLPVARFMPDVTNGCAPLEVNFYDSSRSAQAITSWTYLIAGNEIPALNEITPFTFNDPGDYEVQLVIQNEQGCTDTSYTVLIQVGEKILPYFSVTPSTICSGDTLFLNDASADREHIDSWQYSSPDLFNTGAFGSPDTFLIINPPENGERDVLLSIESNGCISDTLLSDAFSIYGPTGYFEANMDCSSPLDYEFTAFMNDAESYAWKINGTDVTGDDTLIYSFGSTGDYLVELTAGNLTTGCTITKSKVIPVRSITADFSAEPVVCMGNSIEFDASGSADYIETCYVEGFLWDFGDNTRPERTYYEQHAHSFYETGIFEVQLITTALNGCTDTIKRAVEVVQPSADFTVFPSSGCGPSLPVTFNYSGYSSDIDNWTWVFGDLITDDTQVLNPTHSYIAPVSQVFLATLFVEDIYGCTNNLTQPVQVNTPVVDFYAIHSGICAGDEAQFVIATPGVNNYSWDYGDSTGTGMSDTHVYTDPGNYTVELTVEVEGCQRSITRNDYMSVEIADASFMPGDSVFTCYPAVTGFTYTGNSSSIASGRWTFEPGIQSPSYAPNTTYTYTTPGIYLSSLTIVTHNGCTDTQYHTIEVTGPDADYEFSPSFICSGDTVLFRINEMDGVEDFLWVFGDGSTSELQEPEHVYTARGELYPSLILINGECEVTLSEYSLYVSTIRADFEMQPEQDFYCYNGPVHARNNSEDYSSSVWRINGIQVAGSNHLNSSFPLLGENTLTLEVYNALGCSDTLERIYTAIDPPDFSITGDSTVCQNGDLARLHIPEPEDEWTVLWEPGSSIMSPDRFLLNISPDTTTLYTATVTDEWGCVNSHSFLVRVIEPSAIERIPLQDTSIYIGESIMLLINTFNEGSEYAWSPDDHITCTHCNDPLVNPLEDVTYTCRVIDECLDITLEFPVEVIIDFYLELPTAFSPNDDGVNDIFRMEYHNVGEVDFRIFNRWGNLMFSTQDPEEGWDGRSSGKLQNPDSYAYVIRARTIHGYEFERKGTFLLLR